MNAKLNNPNRTIMFYMDLECNGTVHHTYVSMMYFFTFSFLHL
jgi:hypothetical protein